MQRPCSAALFANDGSGSGSALWVEFDRGFESQRPHFQIDVKTRRISHNDAARWDLGRMCGLLGDGPVSHHVAPSRTRSTRVRCALCCAFSAGGVADSSCPGGTGGDGFQNTMQSRRNV